MPEHAHSLDAATLPNNGMLPDSAAGIDLGMTMTKIARATGDRIELSARETASVDAASWPSIRGASAKTGVTGARAAALSANGGAIAAQEIEAAARGCIALLHAEERLGNGEFLMALLGTGTAFASVRGGRVNHMGGTPLGGGSFAGIAYRVAPEMPYDACIAAAERGDRRIVDTMIADVYPDGIGRIGPQLTAAHLSKKGAGSIDDFLAGLLNLHGENIAQIAAGRAAMANAGRVVLCGGFIHNNPRLVESITGMAGLFGVAVEAVSAPGYAGAVGAALIAAEA
jgi:type II pantothenate kinase